MFVGKGYWLPVCFLQFVGKMTKIISKAEKREQLVQASFHDSPFSSFLLPEDKERKKLMGHLLVHTSAKFQICHEMQLLTVKMKWWEVGGWGNLHATKSGKAKRQNRENTREQAGIKEQQGTEQQTRGGGEHGHEGRLTRHRSNT